MNKKMDNLIFNGHEQKMSERKKIFTVFLNFILFKIFCISIKSIL